MITVLLGFKSVSDRWHTSLFANSIETLGNLIQVSIPNDLAGQATVHKDRWFTVWAGNCGWVAKLQVVSGVIDGNCDHPSNSGKDGEVGELIRPHSTCHNHALVVAVGTRNSLTSLVE
jgi:hypothetical protein